MPEQAPQSPEDDEAAGVASALIKARNERGLTQAQLSELSGVSRSAIKGYETGRNMPGSRELKALCLTLKVSPTVLLYGSEGGFAERIASSSSDPAAPSHGHARWQLFAVTKLLPSEEVAALLQLARAIAVARHGVDLVNSNLAAGSSLAEALGPEKLAHTATQMERFADALDAGDAQRVASSGKLGAT